MSDLVLSARRCLPATLARDLPSSFVVFLVALPLCLGIAIASGVPPERGLITGILGGIVVGALAGSPLSGIYNTTKFAVRGLSESLRASLAAHGIGVSVLCPGLVKSYIYASDEIRPEALKGGAKPVNAQNVKRLAEVHQFGMEPDVIAARGLLGWLRPSGLGDSPITRRFALGGPSSHRGFGFGMMLLRH